MECRDSSIDFMKGILITLVVAAHYKSDIVSKIIFLFHMPLFFMISGYLLKQEHLMSKGYLRNKMVSMMIPYSCYLLIDWLLIRRDFSISMIARLVWGGRSLTGTYWYMTCYLITLYIFAFLIKHFSDKKILSLVILGGGG